jgi:hypothetical protein
VHDLGELDLAGHPAEDDVPCLCEGVDDVGRVDVECHREFVAPGRRGRLERAEERELLACRAGGAVDPQAHVMTSHGGGRQ